MHRVAKKNTRTQKKCLKPLLTSSSTKASILECHKLRYVLQDHSFLKVIKMTDSILDQLRALDGHLFQNETVLVLFLDVKSCIVEPLTSLSRTQSSEDWNTTLSSWASGSDDLVNELKESMMALKKASTTGALAHQSMLYEASKKYALLLYPSEMLLVARPKLETLLRGMAQRVGAMDVFKNRSIFSLDPIKQDFVMRDVFRRVLCNDCVVVFEQEPAAVSSEPAAVSSEPAVAPQTAAEEDIDLDSNVGPDDSASALAPLAERPRGARSVIGEDAKTSLTRRTIAPSRIVVEDDTRSQITRLTQSSSMRKPTNVKRIIISNDDAPLT